MAGGAELGEDRALSFTTQTAPSVSEFEVRLLSDHAQPQVHRRQPGSAIAYDVADGAVLGLTPLIDAPIDTLDDASAETGIRIAFTAPMDMADVEPASTSSLGCAATSDGAATRCSSRRAIG